MKVKALCTIVLKNGKKHAGDVFDADEALLADLHGAVAAVEEEIPAAAPAPAETPVEPAAEKAPAKRARKKTTAR